MTWTPPGPGTWLRFRDHFPTPVTPEYAAVFTDTLPAANATLAERYGIPLRTIAAATVNGFVYLSPVPLVAAGRGSPPAPVLWLAARLHPGLRRCARVAARALVERPWRAVMDDWETRLRPHWTERNRDLQTVEPAGLDDGALADHLEACAANWRAGYALHFDLHGTDLLPSGLYLVRGAEWGVARDDLLAALTGWSPASVGADPRLEDLRAALGAARPGHRWRSLEEVRAAGAAPAAALDAYLNEHGWRMVTSYDLDGRALCELPGLVLARLNAPVTAREDPRVAADRAADLVRKVVPAADLDEHDDLLDDARRTYGLRDDNGAVCAAWPVGLVRRALVEAGTRLARSGALHDETHVVELRVAEVAAHLRGGPTPDGAGAAARAGARREAAPERAPDVLGDPLALPPTGVLPRAMGLLTAAQLLLADESGLGEHGDSLAVEGQVTGVGIGRQTVVAVARVLRDPTEALADLEAGEVIVTASTNPSWNAVLPLAGALVVEEGGALSHAAIIARELALPAVVGARGATRVLRSGDVVVVDPVAGTVRAADR
jgi:rifampicin phosphotransferase